MEFAAVAREKFRLLFATLRDVKTILVFTGQTPGSIGEVQGRLIAGG
jgi:hypothetical protein